MKNLLETDNVASGKYFHSDHKEDKLTFTWLNSYAIRGIGIQNADDELFDPKEIKLKIKQDGAWVSKHTFKNIVWSERWQIYNFQVP